MFALNLQDWFNYLGHYHPLIVHLPIGILVVAVILEIVRWRTGQQLDAAIRICLAVAFISAVFSCLFGWFLSREGGYEESTLQLHQWMGIALSAITGICWLLLKFRFRSMFRVLLAIAMVLLTITGHQGGNMTHGEDYLTANLPQPVAGWFGMETKPDSLPPRAPITNIEEAHVLNDLVMPVLQQKCFSCHSASKVKGGLRLDGEDRLFKGGKHGAVVKPGDVAGSELISRLLLPMEDDKRMPPKDKDQLTKEQIQLLSWWVKTGAGTKQKVSELQPDSTVRQWLVHFSSGGGTKEAEPMALSAVYEKNPPAADSASIAALRKLSVLVNPVAQEKTLLQVSCINYRDMDDAGLKALLPLKENIVWLHLPDTKITDAGLSTIREFKNLVQLNMAGTIITSAGIAQLKDLEYLETINLTNTKVDDAALAVLAQIKSLRAIHCWKTAVSEAAAKRMQETHPGLLVVLR